MTSFQETRSRAGGPGSAPQSVPRWRAHPPVEHDDQTEWLLLRFGRWRQGQRRAFISFGDALYKRMNGVVADHRAPAFGVLGRFFVGPRDGGIIGQSLLKLRAQTSPFGQSPLLAHRAMPASRRTGITTNGLNAHAARYRHEREVHLLLPLENQTALLAHGQDRIGRFLKPLLEPPPRPLAPLLEHFLFHGEQCGTHALIPKRYTSFSATDAVCFRS